MRQANPYRPKVMIPLVCTLSALWVFGIGCGADDNKPLNSSEEIEETGSSPDGSEPSTTPDTRTEELADPVSYVPPVLRRLTKSQYQNVLSDILGPDLVLPSSLEPDGRSDGLFAVGASIHGLSPLGVDKYFSAAQSIAKQVTNNLAVRNQVIPCLPSEDVSEGDCLLEVIHSIGRQLWRRDVREDEVSWLLSIAAEARAEYTEEFIGIQYALLSMITSPQFIYIITPTEPTDDGTYTRYSNDAMASRLSFFLWNSAPDEALLDAAKAGLLTTQGGLETEVARMMTDPRAKRGVRAFFSDWLELDALESLQKDPASFDHFNASLGEDAREETLRLVEHIVFTLDTDIRTLFTTTTTFVSPLLAAIYQVAAPSLEGFGAVEFDPEQERAGILGHVSFLAVQAHPTRPSPTLRGVFVREKLLCQSMPPPPANVDTTVPEASKDAPTMKEILEIHMKEPACATCHALTDPIGLGFERFDGIGRYRLLENDVPIDPSGILDGVAFADARGIGRALAEHPYAVPCLVHTLWSYGNGRTPTKEEGDALDILEEEFQADGHRLLNLWVNMALSDLFRHAGSTAP